MGRNSKSSHAANELLNFRFSAPAVNDRQDSSSNAFSRNMNTSRNNNNRNSNNRHNTNNRQNRNYGRHQNNNNNNNRRSAQDRAGARRKANSSMFYLHSSAEHSFHLTRRSPSKVHKEQYVFNGVDEGVSWEAVRVVEHRVPATSDTDGPACPICLCDFVCPRITKCGHSFCLPCILRHVQTYAANNPYHQVKCPCCAIPITVEDLRPVAIAIVMPPVVQSKIRLRKLHRQKQAAAPFLPLPNAPMHGNPHFCPTARVDADAKYSRFNFVDPDFYHSTLVENQMELQREMKSSIDHVEKMHFSLALEIILTQQQRASQEEAEEESLRERYANPTAGMYQPQSPALVFRGTHEDSIEATPDQLSAVAEEWRPVGTDSVEQMAPSSPPVRRYRGDSIGSCVSAESAITHNSDHTQDDSLPKSPGGTAYKKKSKSRPRQGTMYLDESNAVHFYQSDDGQLVFLNGFNMACLLSDYAKGLPEMEKEDSNNNDGTSRNLKAPLPDFIEGRILEVENVQLTPDLRKRMPFLNHLANYTDVSFVELNLNHVLSDETKRKFKNDIVKRRKRRQAKTQAEKRADKAALREEIERINERKARLQIIDPNDDFFQIPSLPPETEFTGGDEFGPALGSGNATSGASTAQHESATTGGPSVNFSAAARRGADPISLSSAEAFPALGAASEAFPALGGASVAKRPPVVEKPAAGASNSIVQSSSQGGKKKKKGQKVLLFSTGGGRAY